jgi:hypothetical protein
MNRALLVLPAIVVIAAAWFVLATVERAPDAIGVKESRTAPSKVNGVQAPRLDEKRRVEKTASGSGTAPAPSASRVTIVGRILRSDQTPATGATLALRFERENEKSEIVETRDGPRSTTPQDGRFHLEFEPVAGSTTRLAAELEACATAGWSWRDLAAGKFVDLGDIVLPTAVSLEARVLDAAGHELTTGWSVSVDPPGAGNSSPFSEPKRVRLDPLHATARFDNLPVGGVMVNADHDVGAGTERVPVDLRAGETARVDLLYTGPDPERIINVVALSKPLVVWGTLLREIVLIDPGGKERALPPRSPQSLQFVAEELEPGPYSIEIRDPRFKPWRADGVMPGTSVEAHLIGSSALVLATSREDPPRDLSVNLKWTECAHYAEHSLDVVSSALPLPTDGRIAGLFAGDIELTARARGRVPLSLKLEKLAPNEERRLVLEFERGGRVAGHVVRRDHVGVKDVDVRAALRNEDRDKGERMNDDDWAPSAMHTRTGDDGSFEFAGLAAGAWTLRAIAAPSVHALLEIQVTNTTDATGLELQVPALGVLKGHVLAPDDLPLAQLSIVTRPVLQGDEKLAFDLLVPEYRPELISGAVHADGSFRCAAVQAGEVDVALALPRVHRTFGFMASGESRGPLLTLGRVVLPPGGELERTFDLRDKLPKRVVVHVTVDGASVPGVTVSVFPQGSNVIVAAGDVGEDGHALLSWLPEGSYEVYVNALDRSFADVAPVPLQVKLGEQGVFEVNVHFIAGDLELRGADRKALADDAPISIVRGGMPTNINGGADAKVKSGRIRLNMPAGTYAVRLTDGERTVLASASIQWPAASYAELETVESR